jgi:hypothetical protein
MNLKVLEMISDCVMGKEFENLKMKGFTCKMKGGHGN